MNQGQQAPSRLELFRAFVSSWVAANPNTPHRPEVVQRVVAEALAAHLIPSNTQTPPSAIGAPPASLPIPPTEDSPPPTPPGSPERSAAPLSPPRTPVGGFIPSPLTPTRPLTPKKKHRSNCQKMTPTGQVKTQLPKEGLYHVA